MSGQHTPGPWAWLSRQKVLNSAEGKILDHCPYEGMWFARYDDEEDEANARLIAAAPDHATALRLIISGKARWEPWDDVRGEFCIGGLRYSTELDEFGCPVVTDHVRAVIAKAEGGAQ